MNRSRFLILIAVAIACLGSWLSRPETLAQEQSDVGAGVLWEYKIVDSDDMARLGAPKDAKPRAGFENDVEEKGLNKLGEDKWELVHVQSVGKFSIRYFLKRPKIGK